MNAHSITTLTQRVNIALRTRLVRLAVVPLLTVVFLAGLATPSFARASAAYNLFKIQYPFTPLQAGYSCMYESYGAVVNNCNTTVYLMFDLVIDTPGIHDIDVLNFQNGGTGVSCTAWNYDGHGNGSGSGSQRLYTTGQWNRFYTATVPQNPNGMALGGITLFCTVPPQEGVAMISWNV